MLGGKKLELQKVVVLMLEMKGTCRSFHKIGLSEADQRVQKRGKYLR